MCGQDARIAEQSVRRTVMGKSQTPKLPSDVALEDELSEADLNQVIGGKKVGPIEVIEPVAD
jgi:bacteriocin-like protein